MKNCCFCGKEIKGFGNDPWPLETSAEDRCCDECNYKYVATARLVKMTWGRAPTLDEVKVVLKLMHNVNGSE